jgi:hypothetical protein
MAISFYTSDPASLLTLFNTRIKQAEAKGRITTWEISNDGKYYTHKAAEWSKEAWLKATAYKDRLTFNIIKSKNKNVSAVAYAYYHGHLIETFLNHFDQKFSVAQATALPTAEDNCGS